MDLFVMLTFPRRALSSLRQRARTPMVDQGRFYAQIGEKIREYRENKLKVTQEEFAARIGLSRPSIANIEKGRQQISVLQLVVFSGVLGIPAEKLIPTQEESSDEPLSASLPQRASHFKDWVDQLQGT